MNTTAKVLVGFLVGTALGAVTGLLMAPNTGRTARKNLNKKAKKLVKQLETFVGKEKGRVSSSVMNGKAPVAAR